MSDIRLSAEQEAEARRLLELMKGAFAAEAEHLARLLASKPDAQLLGKTEFEVRDAVHRLGAKAIETALRERKKGGTAAPASPAPTAAAMPAASATAAGASLACSAPCGWSDTTITARPAATAAAPATATSA